MKTREEYNEREWEEIASFVSDESNEETKTIGNFLNKDGRQTYNYWKKMKINRGDMNVDVDKAWDSLHSRLREDKLLTGSGTRKIRLSIGTLIRVAASVVILVGLAFGLRYAVTSNFFVPKSTIVASIDEKNKFIELEDGSRIYMNRESELTYPSKFNSRKRIVTLKGEAYFEITPDPERPFIIDAGDGIVEVMGTSFSVKSSNNNNDIEVFVTTGKVILSSTDGLQKVILEPGFIGTVNNKTSYKTLNEDLNYLAWNTETLVYEGNTLEQVFDDLEEVYNLSVKAKDYDILSLRLTSTFNKNKPETIIRLICTTFNLRYEKAGDIYYLER